MKQSKFNADVSHLTFINKWDYWWGDWRLLCCLLQCLCPVHSVSRNAPKRFTAHRSEETICCSVKMKIPQRGFKTSWCKWRQCHFQSDLLDTKVAGIALYKVFFFCPCALFFNRASCQTDSDPQVWRMVSVIRPRLLLLWYILLIFDIFLHLDLFLLSLPPSLFMLFLAQWTPFCLFSEHLKQAGIVLFTSLSVVDMPRCCGCTIYQITSFAPPCIKIFNLFV